MGFGGTEGVRQAGGLAGWQIMANVVMGVVSVRALESEGIATAVIPLVDFSQHDTRIIRRTRALIFE